MKRPSVPVSRLTGWLGAILFTAAPLGAQQTVEGVQVVSKAIELEIGGRVQTQFNTTSVESEPTSEWLLRRVRLEAEVKVNDLVSGKVQPDFAGDRVSLKDAYLKLDFAPGLQVLAGKAHRPFSLLEQTSSTLMLPIERGVDIRGVTGFDQYELIHDLDYSDREIGLQVMGEPSGAPLGFSYAAGVFRGPLQGQVGSSDTYQLAARATITPLEDVHLGAGWSSRDFASSVGTGFQLERGHAFEVDVEYGSFSPGLHVLGEVTVGDYDPFTERSFSGAQAWLGYRSAPVGILSTIEPLLRVSYGDVDETDEVGGTLVTPGLNVYFGGRNRFMVNYDLWNPGGESEAEGSFKAMFQMVF